MDATINAWHVEPGLTAEFEADDFECWWLAGRTREDRVAQADQTKLIENCIYLARAEQRRMLQTIAQLRTAVRDWAKRWNDSVRMDQTCE